MKRVIGNGFYVEAALSACAMNNTKRVNPSSSGPRCAPASRTSAAATFPSGYEPLPPGGYWSGMSSPPEVEQYRANAATCDRAAETMVKPEAQAELKTLARLWQNLANHVDSIIEGPRRPG